METGEALKMFAGPVVAFILGRLSKQTDATGEHGVRLAIISERLDALKDRVALLEKEQKTQWAKIDELGEDFG